MSNIDDILNSECKPIAVKTKFHYPAGQEGMRIDIGEYIVEVCKLGGGIQFKKKDSGNYLTLYGFYVDWDDEKDGGKITIKTKDRWGSEICFTHFEPTDIKYFFELFGNMFGITHAIKSAEKIVGYKCLLCGRDKFVRKTPHKCKGGFRKHNFEWQAIYNVFSIIKHI